MLHAFPAAVARLDALRLGLVHQLDHGAGAGLNPGGARAAALFVLLERGFQIVFAVVLQHGRQHPGVLDALAGALGQERHHRVGGVAHQRYPAVGPAVDRVAVEHAGEEGGVDLIHHRLGARLQVGERRAQLVDVAALGPGLAVYLAGGHRGENAVQVLGADPVGDQGAAGTEPVVAALIQIDAFQLLGGNQRPPHQDVGEVHVVLAEQLLADHRVDAVGGDQHMAVQVVAVFHMHGDAVVVLGEAGAVHPEPHRLGGQGVGENLDQVGAVDVVQRRAPALRAFLAQRRHVQQLAVADITHVERLRDHRLGRHGLLQTELAQHHRTVAGDLDAGADLGKLRGLFNDGRVDALVA